MIEKEESCSNSTCGCRVEVFTTDRMCPSCGKRLHISGNTQRLELRLNCQSCGYHSPHLSQEELHNLL